VDCILYIDLFFLWNFWMNALVLFLVRQITKNYRTLQCLIAALLGAGSACLGVICYILLKKSGVVILLEVMVLIYMNLLAFGRKNLLWHLFLFCIFGVSVAGSFLYLISCHGFQRNTLAMAMVSFTAIIFCVVLEKKSRIQWKEEHMKAKTVLEFGNRKLCATALVDTGNKLYDPISHKPVILADEKMIGEMLTYCREKCPEKLRFIPFYSVGKENGLLEGLTFDCVNICWQNKQMKFRDVIVASTKESLYKGKEYQVIFHCGLLQEG